MTQRSTPVARTRVEPVSDHDAEVICGTPCAVNDGGYLRPARSEQEFALFRGLDDYYTLK